MYVISLQLCKRDLAVAHKKVIDLELTEPLYDVRAGTRYGAVRALVRLRGAPLGSIELPLDDGVVSTHVVARTIYEHLAWPLARQYLPDQFAQPLSAPVESVTWPALSVIVCTRDRPADLATCLESLLDLEYPGDLEVIVVDNAPADDRSARLVQERSSGVHYVREERPGLNRARNRGVAQARYDIVAFVGRCGGGPKLGARAGPRLRQAPRRDGRHWPGGATGTGDGGPGGL